LHKRGIVHRDIKPGNVVRSKNGAIKIIDLGLASLTSSPDKSSTSDDTLIHTTRAQTQLLRSSRAAGPVSERRSRSTLQAVLLQVLIVDVVFSLDSVITAVGMTEGLQSPIQIMIAAIVISVVVMLVFSKAIVSFIERHPALKILALSFMICY